MTIHFPDVSHWNKGYEIPTGTPIVIARASLSTSYSDDTYQGFKVRALNIGAVFVGYHWLNNGREVEQAKHAFSIVGPNTPLMIDAEDMPGNTGYNGSNTVANILAFANAYRQLGGIVSLVYLPKWYWSDHLGSPSLIPLRDTGLHLVSSNYTAYSDSGPGWNAYGGVLPEQWQYRGSPLDLNAYRGTREAYSRMVGAKVLTPHAEVAGMIMVRKDGEASVDLFDDNGHKRWHVTGEPERDVFIKWGVPFFDGVSPDLYEALTTVPGTEVSLPPIPSARDIAVALIDELKGQ